MTVVDFTKDAEEAPYLFIILFSHFNVTASNKEDVFFISVLVRLFASEKATN